MTSAKYNINSLKRIRERSNQWLTEHTELMAAKLERIMIACHGYHKIQPVRLSKSAATMTVVAPLRQQKPRTNQSRGRSRNATANWLHTVEYSQCQRNNCPATTPPISVMNKC